MARRWIRRPAQRGASGRLSATLVAGAMLVACRPAQPRVGAEQAQTIGQRADSAPRLGVMERSPVRGSPQGVVTLVVFSDFFCVSCRILEQKLSQAMGTSWASKDIKLTWRSFPSDAEPGAMQAIEAAYAAWQQGAFWEFHDKLLAAPELDQKAYDEFAKALALDLPKFHADAVSLETRAAIRADMGKASELDVASAPALFIDGQRISAEISLEALKSLLEREVKDRAFRGAQ